MVSFGEEIVRMLLAAGDASLCARDKQFYTYSKLDGSLVTTVDFLVDDIIKDGLRILYPDVPIVSEENPEEENMSILTSQSTKGVFMVDPIDGTYSLIRNGEYCINVSYVENGIPLLGAIAIPTRGEVFFCNEGGVYRATKDGVVQLERSCKILSRKRDFYSMITNRRHVLMGENLISANTIREGMLSRGFSIESSRTVVAAIKYCTFLESEADFVVSFGNLSLWDLAAPYAILAKFGIPMINELGSPLQFENNEDKPLVVISCENEKIQKALLQCCWNGDLPLKL